MAGSTGALVVHLDLNKSVLMSDPAAGASMPALLSGVLAAAAWGTVGADGRWTLSEPRLRARRPPTPAGLQPQMSYLAWVKECAHPFEAVTADDTASVRAAASSHNKIAKKRQQVMLARFTLPGEPGEAFAPVLAALLARLAVPPESTEACISSGLLGLRDGKRFLLPSYFRLLETLIDRGGPFLIVLRTFGNDLEAVVAEHNAWAMGTHPTEPPASTDSAAAARRVLAIDPAALAAVARGSDDSGSVALRVAGGGEHVGARAIFDHLRAQAPAAGGAVRGVRDDYDAWFAHGEVARAGKLMPMDPEGDALHIFFDDNLGDERHVLCMLSDAQVAGLPLATDDGTWADAAEAYEDDGADAGIVHACTADGASLPYMQTRNVHLVRVCPLAAILNAEYFVQALDACERRWRARRAAKGDT